MPPVHSPVRNVSVISTGTGSLHPEHMYGTHKPSLWWIARSKEWITVPLNVFVIEHEDGLVLFDTGIDQAAVTDPDYWPDGVTRWFMDHIFNFDIKSEDRLATQLERAGYRPKDVVKAVLSHLHFDHVGGIGDIPDAELLVAPEAWEHMVTSPHPEREAVPRKRIAVPGAKWQTMDFEPTDDPELASFNEAFDVMGDGSLVVVPTPGHLAGSVSMLIRRFDAPPVLLIGDLTYSEDLLQRDQVAATGDKSTLLESYVRVRDLKAHIPQLVVIASHDTTAVEKLASARDRKSSTV